MKLVSYEDVRALSIGPRRCIEWVADTLARKSEMELPPKISLHPYEGSFMNTMPCLVRDGAGKTWGGLSSSLAFSAVCPRSTAS